jgi:DNA-binding protein H-NS
VGELAEEHLAELHAQEETLRKQEEEKRLAALTEAERAYELLSKGKCPNCSTVQPLSSNQCSSCGALFGKDAWNLLPIGIPPNQ